MGFSPDMIDEYNIHVDAVAFTRELNKYEAECVHKLSIGSVSSNTSNAISEFSPFVEEQTNDPMGHQTRIQMQKLQVLVQYRIMPLIVMVK